MKRWGAHCVLFGWGSISVVTGFSHDGVSRHLGGRDARPGQRAGRAHVHGGDDQLTRQYNEGYKTDLAEPNAAHSLISNATAHYSAAARSSATGGGGSALPLKQDRTS